MNYFVWQDLIALAGAFFGAIQSSRVIPNFPITLYIARFVIGLHISVIVAIFGTMTTAANLMMGVNWVQTQFGFYIPLIGYAIIIVMGMTTLVSATLQTLIIISHQNTSFLYLAAGFMAIFDLFVLIHMMSIF